MIVLVNRITVIDWAHNQDRNGQKRATKMNNISHKTGFLFQLSGGSSFGSGTEVFDPGVESWHRTLRGAWLAREKNDGRGKIFRLISEDQSEEVPE